MIYQVQAVWCSMYSIRHRIWTRVNFCELGEVQITIFDYNRCSSRWECGVVTGASQWLSPGEDRCPYFEAIVPPHIPLQQRQVMVSSVGLGLKPASLCFISIISKGRDQ